jgi:hypothetical protein
MYGPTGVDPPRMHKIQHGTSQAAAEARRKLGID